MTYLFDHLEQIIKLVAQPPVGLITDFDGTISPIAPTPQDARISQVCRRFLDSLTLKLALVAVISGRPVTQVRDMVDIDGAVYIGSHGMERWSYGCAELSSAVRDYVPVIELLIRDVSHTITNPGIIIENKGAAVTFHYRLAPDPEAAVTEIMKAIQSSEAAKDLRIIRGKMAIEVIAPVEINKGTATLSLIRDYNLNGAIYLGDDVTDIDAFKALRSASQEAGFQGITVAVTGPESPSGLLEEANFTLKGVSDVERFLKWLAQDGTQ